MPDFLSMMPVKNPQMYTSGATPAAPAAPAIPGTPTSYQDVIAKLNEGKGAGGATFGKGIDNATGQITAPGVLDPGYQKTLDQIRSNAAFYGAKATSAASSLAAKRGITGSSTEAFGVQTGLAEVNRTAAEQEAAVYRENLARQQALKDQVTKMLGDRAGQETTAGTSLATTGAQLTSDEVASVRNMDLTQRQLALQQQLGQQGIDVSKQNIETAQQIAKQQGWMNFGQAVVGGAMPWMLAKLWPAQAATQGIAAGAGGIPGLQGGAPLVGGTVPGTVAFGPGGTVLNTAGTSGIGLGTVAGGAAGVYGAEKIYGDNRYVNTGATAGAVAGSVFGPAGSAAGAVVGGGVGKYGDQAYTSVRGNVGATAASLAKPFIDPAGTVADAGEKLGLLSGKHHTQMQYSGRDYSKYDVATVAQNLGKAGWGVDYDSNRPGSFENNFNSMLNTLGSDGLVARYSSPDAKLTTTADRSLKQYYDDAVSLYGPNVTGKQYLQVVGNRNPPAAAAIIGASIKAAA